MRTPAAPPDLRGALTSQYHAGLAMLGEAVRLCPEELWTARPPTNAFWQVAYHTLFFTHLYLQPDEESFRPWSGHQRNVRHPDAMLGQEDEESSLPLLPEPYTKEQVLAYCSFCDERVDAWVDALDLAAPMCGFPWYPLSKIEHQLVNLRHLQHGAAQLADRLRASIDAGVRWMGRGPRGS